jgi:RHS repeat-associated protein
VNYGYDDLYRLSSETVLDAAGTVTRQANYTYDDVGNRTGLSDSAVGTTAYQYDKNDRLLSETGATNATYTYDGNGNTKSVTQGGQTTTYTWDNRNRMISQSTVNSQQSTVSSYTYNDENIRVSSKVGTQAATQFLLDGNRDYSQVLAESKGGTIGVSYVYGNDLVSQKRGTAESFYLVDGLGSTRGLTNSAGTLTDSYTYDSFGNLVASTGTTTNSYLFAGEQYDSNLDQYYLRQRFYDAGTGRFTRRDDYEGRVSEPMTLHKYVYGNANPVNYTDPSGLFSMGDVGAANAIRDILTNIQLDTGSNLINVLLGDRNEDSSSSEWDLNQLTGLLATTIPIAGTVVAGILPDLAQALPRFSGGQRIFAHFTSVEGITGITGLSASRLNRLKVGETVVVRKLAFKQGKNAFNTTTDKDIFVTELGLNATQGQLGRIGVFGDKQNFVIQMSGEELFTRNGMSVRSAQLQNGGSIFSMPAAGQKLHGQFLVTRVR